MKLPTRKWILPVLFILAIALGLLKDMITPDYRNTPAAWFLNPIYCEAGRLNTILLYPIFWLKAIIYTGIYIAIPTLVIRFAFENPSLTRLTLGLMVVVSVGLYVSILLNHEYLDRLLVSKINRYLHSPIITMFLWAAFTLSRLETNKNG
ncbi:MAG: hypothetical protein MUC81_14005 [Bacteroidia bacterium]|jgi:hypothetical protein|nr:hypothetical protein [Bacteroidia bacterium]